MKHGWGNIVGIGARLCGLVVDVFMRMMNCFIPHINSDWKKHVAFKYPRKFYIDLEKTVILKIACLVCS